MAGAFYDALRERGIVEPVDAIISFIKISMTDTGKHYEEKYHIDDAFWIIGIGLFANPPPFCYTS